MRERGWLGWERRTGGNERESRADGWEVKLNGRGNEEALFSSFFFAKIPFVRAQRKETRLSTKRKEELKTIYILINRKRSPT